MSDDDRLATRSRPHEPPAEICTASVSLAASLALATALVLALIGVAVWQLLL